MDRWGAAARYFAFFVFLIVLLFLSFKKVTFELLRNARLISEEKKFILVIPEIFVILWYRGGRIVASNDSAKGGEKKERERETKKKVYVCSTLWSPGVILKKKKKLFLATRKKERKFYWLLNIKCREISVMFFGWYTSAIAKTMWTEKKSIRNFMSMFGVVWYIVRGARLCVSGEKKFHRTTSKFSRWGGDRDGMLGNRWSICRFKKGKKKRFFLTKETKNIFFFLIVVFIINRRNTENDYKIDSFETIPTLRYVENFHRYT